MRLPSAANAASHEPQGRAQSPMLRGKQAASRRRLAELLAAERKRAGLRQVDLAKRLRRPQSFVATIESGRRHIDVIEFLGLAEIIGFDAGKALKRLRQETGRKRRSVNAALKG
jgi:ribosome-binding protein aMBF1 (putative translation factor)